MTEVRLTNVTKQFRDVTAVDSIDLQVPDGEFVVIVGPSGCGKSTTLRTIAGLEQPNGGAIHFGDTDVTDIEPKNRNVAMVFQNYALYPHMSARRNMTFGMQSAGTFTDEEVDERVAEAAETLGITDLLDRKPSALSGGEQQRVAIGRALVRDPDVLLMDEPLSNLDAKLRVQMRTELAALHEQLGVTTVYVTHDQTEAMTLGERVVVMNDGDIQQVDEPQRIYDYPETRFVAGFIGSPSMNQLAVSVETRSGGTSISHADFEIELPAGTDLDTGEAVLGIRPEDLHPAEAVNHTHARPITLDVTLTESLGDVMLAYGTLAEQEIVIQIDAHEEVAAGDTLELVCDPARIHLFDVHSGEALYHSDPEYDSVSSPSPTANGPISSPR